MVLSFVVGAYEPHTVAFSFDKFWGKLAITVDSMSVVRETQIFSINAVNIWEFWVGFDEKHLVRIEKHRKVFFAGFRPQTIYAFVDDVLVAQHAD
jgi:hypothetical protein